jgi:hypothetical protein
LSPHRAQTGRSGIVASSSGHAEIWLMIADTSPETRPGKCPRTAGCPRLSRTVGGRRGPAVLVIRPRGSVRPGRVQGARGCDNGVSDDGLRCNAPLLASGRSFALPLVRGESTACATPIRSALKELSRVAGTLKTGRRRSIPCHPRSGPARRGPAPGLSMRAPTCSSEQLFLTAPRGHAKALY